MGGKPFEINRVDVSRAETKNECYRRTVDNFGIDVRRSPIRSRTLHRDDHPTVGNRAPSAAPLRGALHPGRPESGHPFKVVPMTTFDAGRMFAFDLETTGTDPHECRIVTSALVRIDGGPPQTEELLADPGVEIPEGAARVHGITTEYAREHGRPHDEVLADTIAAIRRAWSDGLTLVAYNAAYDLTVLRSRQPDFTVDGLVFDPLVIDRARDTHRRGKRTLGNVCEHYRVRLDNAHEATADALAAARLAWVMSKKVWPDLAEMDGDELMEYQAVSHFESQSSLRDWLVGQGRDVSDFRIGGWPIDEPER